MRPMKQIARRLRKEQTGSEAALWNCLRNRRLEGRKFRRQVAIAGYIADFACLEAKLTIELDGIHHNEQLARDMARRTLIELHGYLEIRFSNDDVKERLDWVVEEIKRALDIAAARIPRASAPRFDV